MKRIRQCLSDRKGSSIISVLVAFAILLLGIGAFAAAIGTANDMVRRAEMLNIATGQVLERFYQDYAMTPVDNRIFVTDVNRVEFAEDGTMNVLEPSAFQLHTKLREKEYELTLKDESDSEEAPLKYEMYYYK